MWTKYNPNSVLTCSTVARFLARLGQWLSAWNHYSAVNPCQPTSSYGHLRPPPRYIGTEILPRLTCNWRKTTGQARQRETEEQINIVLRHMKSDHTYNYKIYAEYNINAESCKHHAAREPPNCAPPVGNRTSEHANMTTYVRTISAFVFNKVTTYSHIALPTTQYVLNMQYKRLSPLSIITEWIG